MLSVEIFYCYDECHYADCRYADCHGALHSDVCTAFIQVSPN